MGGVKWGCVSGPRLTEETEPNLGRPTAAPRLLQLVREDTDPAGEGGNADSEKEKVGVRCGHWAWQLGFVLPPGGWAFGLPCS